MGRTEKAHVSITKKVRWIVARELGDWEACHTKFQTHPHSDVYKIHLRILAHAWESISVG